MPTNSNNNTTGTADASKDASDSEDERENNKKLCMVVKIKHVEEVKLKEYAENIQAILINPKWKIDHGRIGKYSEEKNTTSQTDEKDNS
jgi:hypothetical protein